MSTYSDKMREMINNADDQIDGIDDSTAQIEIQIEEYESQRDGIQYGLMDNIAFIDLSSYLVITKAPEKSTYGDGYVVFGGDYGVVNVTDWAIHDSTTGDVVYTFEGVNWDDDPVIIEYVNQWNFGYDYIHHTFGITGTYGLQDKIDQLYDALGLLQANRYKIGNSKGVFENYAS